MSDPNPGPIIIRTTPSPKRLVVFLEAHVGRNQLCPCGSQLKYKKCCLPRLSLPEYQAQVRLYEAAYGVSSRRSYYTINPSSTQDKDKEN